MPENDVIDNVAPQATEEDITALSEEKLDTPPESEASESTPDEPEIDYERLVMEDMAALSEEFSDGAPIKITDLKNPSRYGALRDLGLTPKEAFLASGGKISKVDNRSHLLSSVPRNMTSSFSEIPRAHLDMARELFSELSDSEIKSLYRKVTQ